MPGYFQRRSREIEFWINQIDIVAYFHVWNGKLIPREPLVKIPYASSIGSSRLRTHKADHLIHWYLRENQSQKLEMKPFPLQGKFQMIKDGFWGVLRVRIDFSNSSIGALGNPFSRLSKVRLYEVRYGTHFKLFNQRLIPV